MQTVKGNIKIYHPAQNPATGNATKNKIKNQTRLHPALPLPSPAAIFQIPKIVDNFTKKKRIIKTGLHRNRVVK